MKEVDGVKLYTKAEIAELLGISLNGVTTIIKRGDLSPIRIGRSVFISEDNFRTFLNATPKKDSDKAQ